MFTNLSDRRQSVERLRPTPSLTCPITFHYEIQNHATRMQKLTKVLNVYRLTMLTLICVVAGLTIGLICRPFAKNWSERHFMYIEMPGELYLRLLKLMIIPLIVSNVILSFGTIQGKLSTHLAKVACFLYLGSNLMALTVAIVVALLVCPGKHHPSHNPNYRPPAKQETSQFDKHHYFNEYHDSIARYREYHPMFYHTDRNTWSNDKIVMSTNEAHSRNTNKTQEDLFKIIEVRRLEKNSTSQIFSDKQVDILIRLAESQSKPLVEKDELQLYRVDEDIKLDSNNQAGGDDETLLTGSTHSKKQANYDRANEIRHIGLNTKLPIDVLLDVLRNLVPESIIGATLRQTRTRLFAPKELILGKDGSMNPPPSEWPMGHEMIDQANIIGLLAISVLSGVILSHMEEASKPMLELCSCVSELSLRIGMLTINFTPICIMFLLIGQVARARDLSSMAGELFMYSSAVITALVVHGFILLPLVYYLITKQSPIKFLLNMLEALVASFATSSSSATMPLMLNCLVDMDMNPVIVRAFGPLGSVFNMNGTAIYEAIGAIFIAKTLGITLPLTSLLLVGLSSAVASLSTTGIPSSGMMTMVIVLNAVNLPVLQLSLIYIVDFIIDRFRTVINVWSAATVCALINHICPEHMFGEELKPEKYLELVKIRGSRSSNHSKRSLDIEEKPKPQIISVTITPPVDNTNNSNNNTTSSFNNNNSNI